MFPRQIRTPFPHPNAPGPWPHLFSNPAHLANLPIISLFPLPKLHHFCAPLLSSPSRGTWIEIVKYGTAYKDNNGRPPHGGRGLKCFIFPVIIHFHRSSPSRGTWIEIRYEEQIAQFFGGRPPHGGRGLKCPFSKTAISPSWSSPSRGTWIEIPAAPGDPVSGVVVPLTGDVD